MALAPIHMPQLGESIAEATIVRVLFKEGDPVVADADIIEVETNKAVMGVTAPCSGTLGQILAETGQSYPVGAVLGYIEVSSQDAVRLVASAKTLKPPVAWLFDRSFGPTSAVVVRLASTAQRSGIKAPRDGADPAARD